MPLRTFALEHQQGVALFPFPKIKTIFPSKWLLKDLNKKYAEQHVLNIPCKSSWNSEQKTQCNKDMYHLTWEKKIVLIPWGLLSLQTYS